MTIVMIIYFNFLNFITFPTIIDVKKIYKIAIIILSFCVVALGGYILISKTTIHNPVVKKISKTFNENVTLDINISGAIKYPGTYTIKKGETLRYVLSSAKLLNNADIAKVDFDTPIQKVKNINIPFRVDSSVKLKLSEYNNVEQLTKFKIPLKIANGILILVQNKKGIAWNDIDDLPGVGKTYLTKLKFILTLDL